MKLYILSLALFFSCQQHNSKLFETDTLPSNNQYQKVVQPIFNNKCIACHSCYNAPCQLKLTSYEGLNRGAHRSSVYDFPPLKAKEPTRLYVDAHSQKEWHDKGFFPVTSSEKFSLLAHLIDNKGPYRKLNYKKSEQAKQCSNLVGDYPINNYNSYMPYGFPKLSQREVSAIKNWEKTGEPGLMSWELEEKILNDNKYRNAINKWERLFNQQSLKAQLSTRYIYEHLFLAHLYFSFSTHQFFRLVRSETQTGRIKELATVYPFDKPDKDFYYRLRPITQTLVHKSHIPFPLNDTKYDSWNKDFYKSKWEKVPSQMPAYGKQGANPFKTFMFIPAIARYRFFLEESAYHIMTFIKGPVCRGPTALNVINDHFWVTFIDPKHDPIVNNKRLEKRIAQLMELPAQIKDDFKPFKDFRTNYWKANKVKMSSIKNSGKKLNKDWLWNGEKENTNSLITVYRHYDSAQVLRGLIGVTPKTVWTLDYHVFETIYYNLTAGYNVFGPLLHQVNSRLFMELSRISSEDLFISFLNTKSRESLRNYWNRKVPNESKGLAMNIVDSFIQNAKKEMMYVYPFNGKDLSSSIKMTSVQAFKEDIISQHYSKKQIGSKSERLEPNFKLSAFKNHAFRHLPDTIMLKLSSKNSAAQYYTLILNRSHYNVSMMFLENDRRDFKNDHIDVVPGIASSYANLFIVTTKEELPKIMKELKSVSNRKEVTNWIMKYGLLRNHSSFWEHYKDFSLSSFNKITNERGWLDLNRYSLIIDGNELVEKKF